MRKLKLPLVAWLSYVGLLVTSLLFATLFPYITYNNGIYKTEIHFTGINKDIYDTAKIITKIPPDQFQPITTALILVGLLLIVISSVTIAPIFPSKKLSKKTEILIVNVSRFIHVIGSLVGIIGVMCFICYVMKNELMVLYHFSIGFAFTLTILTAALLVGIITIFFAEDKSEEIT